MCLVHYRSHSAGRRRGRLTETVGWGGAALAASRGSGGGGDRLRLAPSAPSPRDDLGMRQVLRPNNTHDGQ